MAKKNFRRLIWVGLAGVVVVFMMLLLFGYVGSNHSSAQGSKLSIGPNPASPGTTVMVTGFKYSPAKKVDVYFQSRVNGVVSTVANAGGFFDVALRLPKKYTNEPSYVYAVSGTSMMKTLVRFTKPSLAYTTTSQFAGKGTDLRSFARINGTGFVANEPINFELRDKAATLKIGKMTTDAKGDFTLPLDLANAPYRSHSTLTVTDNVRPPVSLDVASNPSILITPSLGIIQTQVNVSGSGFGPSESVNIAFQSRLVAQARTNQAGSFFRTFRVPSSATIDFSVNNVRAVGRRSNAVAFASFQVYPAIYIVAGVVQPRQVIFAGGSQFSPMGAVQMLLVDPNSSGSAAGIPLGAVTASQTGTFSTSFTIPSTVTRGKTYHIVFIDIQTGISKIHPIYVQ
jgi:hypothetical protein